MTRYPSGWEETDTARGKKTQTAIFFCADIHGQSTPVLYAETYRDFILGLFNDWRRMVG